MSSVKLAVWKGHNNMSLVKVGVGKGHNMSSVKLAVSKGHNMCFCLSLCL